MGTNAPQPLTPAEQEVVDSWRERDARDLRAAIARQAASDAEEARQKSILAEEDEQEQRAARRRKILGGVAVAALTVALVLALGAGGRSS